MDAHLFSRLWREIDFDDHPHTGGHGSEPEGNLVTDFGEGWIRLKDERMSLSLGVDCEADSVHRWTTQSVQMNEGPTRLGVHRWSISPDDLGVSTKFELHMASHHFCGLKSPEEKSAGQMFEGAECVADVVSKLRSEAKVI